MNDSGLEAIAVNLCYIKYLQKLNLSDTQILFEWFIGCNYVKGYGIGILADNLRYISDLRTLDLSIPEYFIQYLFMLYIYSWESGQFVWESTWRES